MTGSPQCHRLSEALKYIFPFLWPSAIDTVLYSFSKASKQSITSTLPQTLI